MKDWLELPNDVKIDLTEYKEEELNDIEKIKLKNALRKEVSKPKKNSITKKVAVASVTII